MKTGKVFTDNLVGVNQLMPIVNKFAWDAYHKGLANFWIPTEIPMQIDIQQWKRKDALNDDERLLLKRCLGFFAGAESLVGNNLLINMFRFITDPDCRQYIQRQVFEESLHNLMVVYICESLGLKDSEIYQAYINVPAIKAKDEFLMSITQDVMYFDPNSIEDKRKILRNLVTYYIVCEGLFFYSGFAMLLNFRRQGKMPGIAEQVQYTLRDESVHIQFGIDLINLIRIQEPDLWDNKFNTETTAHLIKATELEIQYAKDVLPRGILGLNSEMFVQYMKYIANRRVESLGYFIPLFEDVQNPFPWLSEAVDLKKQKNFFETRVIEYQTGTIKDDLD